MGSNPDIISATPSVIGVALLVRHGYATDPVFQGRLIATDCCDAAGTVRSGISTVDYDPALVRRWRGALPFSGDPIEPQSMPVVGD
jgi:hypothetical protein